MMKRILSCILLFILFVGAGLPLQKSSIRVKDSSLTVEWAKSESERIQGLQGRSHLPEDEGMIFDYGDSEQFLKFWMKNTLIPLSIAFVDKNGRIRQIEDMEPNTLRPHASKRKVRYALEVNQGWFRRHGIQDGDTLQF